jgi:hypothetical protein
MKEFPRETAVPEMAFSAMTTDRSLALAAVVSAKA